MSEAVELENNLILIPNADLSYRSGIRVVINKVVAVCTANYLFAIPIKVTTASITGRARQSSDASSSTVVHEIVHQPGQTVHGVEQALLQLAEGQENVALKLADLKAYKLKGWGPFRQFALWRPGQSMPISFVPRGKGELKRFEAFCSKRVPARTA